MKFLRTAAALTLFAVAGCGDSTGPSDVSGSWTLQTVNGDTPPAIVYEDAFYKLEVFYAEYDINANGTYTLTSDLSEDDGPIFREVELGTYSLDGSRITFEDDEGFSLTGTISNDRLTFSELGVTLVYERNPMLE